MNNNKIKEEFISTLSHEIRTPLTSIKGFSQTMLNSWELLDENKKKEFLKIILGQSQRLINLVENVLNVAKIDSDSENVILTKINAQTILNNCINVLSVNYKNYKFNIEKPKNELFVLADNDKLTQILINILDNALKYSINCEKIDIKIFEQNDFVIFSIKNYGSFIEQNDIQKVFDKFYRVDSFITSTTQGSGLGLYIAKNLVNKMQGKIEINSSEKEKYCEFLIYLPVWDIEKSTKK